MHVQRVAAGLFLAVAVALVIATLLLWDLAGSLEAQTAEQEVRIHQLEVRVEQLYETTE